MTISKRQIILVWIGCVLAGLIGGVMLAALIAINLWIYGFRDAVSQNAPLVGCVIAGLIVGVDIAIQQTKKIRRTGPWRR